jgi:hypothetical protein
MRINSAPHRPLSYRGKRMEAQTGVEPVWTDLQSVAWPLCYRAEEEKKWRPAGRKKDGAHGRSRTFNRWVWSPVLCQLSYTRVNE